MHISAAELNRRVIEPDQFVPDPTAFVDVRLPQSKGKESLSFIGPGVSQNSDQVINIEEPHGFNVGAARLPAGAINNPHLHFTAEVFICRYGFFRFFVGLGDDALSLDVGPGDVVSVPTWVFRSFENIGTEQGFVYTALGNDVTGGIIWAPEVLTEAAETGLFLDKDALLLDTVNGDSVDQVELMPRMREEDVRSLPQPTEEDLAVRFVPADQRQWISGSLLSSCLEGHRVDTAPLIGHGFIQRVNSSAPIPGHHSFTATWLRAEPGQETGLHAVDQYQVAYLIDGSWQVDCNPELDVSATPQSGSLVSMPPGSWRTLRAIGDETATMVLVTAGDSRPDISWSDDIVNAARQANIALDANGCIGPAHLIENRGGPCASTHKISSSTTTGREI